MERETYEEKEVKPTEKVLASKTVTCNKCGTSRELKPNGDWYESEEGLYANDVHNISLGFGYGSRFDMEQWSFDLCDDCLDDVVRTFKYAPDGFRYDGYTIIETEEEKQKVFDNYRETGEWEELRFKTYEQLKELKGIYRKEYINEVVKENFPDKPLF